MYTHIYHRGLNIICIENDTVTAFVRVSLVDEKSCKVIARGMIGNGEKKRAY